MCVFCADQRVCCAQATKSQVYSTIKTTAETIYEPFDIFHFEGDAGPANMLFAAALIITTFSLISSGAQREN